MVYPIAFLYRQYIELQLKDIIKESRIVLSEDSGFPKHHKIQHLWDVSEQLMRKIIATVDSSAGEYITADDFSFIGSAIKSFVEIDPESMVFRYPEDKNGNSSIESLPHINIRNLADQISELETRLKKFNLAVSFIRDWQQQSMRVRAVGRIRDSNPP